MEVDAGGDCLCRVPSQEEAILGAGHRGAGFAPTGPWAPVRTYEEEQADVGLGRALSAIDFHDEINDINWVQQARGRTNDSQPKFPLPRSSSTF